MIHQDITISDLQWKLQSCVATLKWYAGNLSPEDRINDNGDKAAETLEDINDNKN